jgi:hypothetical protein
MIADANETIKEQTMMSVFVGWTSSLNYSSLPDDISMISGSQRFSS